MSEVAQFCLTLCGPMDCSLSGSSSMGFSRQECYSGLPLPSPRDLPDPGIEPWSPTLQADTLPSEPPGKALILVGGLVAKSNSCDPMDCSLPGSSVHKILQARILEWFAISFSRGSSRHRD